MMKTAKRFLSMLLVLAMMLSLFVSPAMAASAETSVLSGTVGQTNSAVKNEAAKEDKEDSADKSGDRIIFDKVIFRNETVLVDGSATASDDVVVDRDDPVILLVEEELRTMKVVNEDGEKVGLTEEQIANALGLYQQYLDHWTANANVLGIQVPFFLAYNDTEDELGILGEMLALANVPLSDVRSGDYSYNDLMGMIETFIYGDTLGVQYYGSAIAAARDEVLALVAASGAKTDAQKLLILNDWLAHVNTFDMPYIMNNGKEEGEKPMVAPTPVKFDRYDDVYSTIHGYYVERYTNEFHNMIYAGVIADMRQTFYEQAIRSIMFDSAKDAALTEIAKQDAFVSAGVEAFRQEQYAQALEAEEQKVYDAAYEKSYRDYMNTNCAHTTLTAVMDWEASTADVTCSNCGLVFADQAASVVKDEAQSVAPSCTAEGKDVLVATITVVGDDGASLGSLTATKTEILPAVAHSFDGGVCTMCGADETTVASEIATEEVAQETATVYVNNSLVRKAQQVAKIDAEDAVAAAAEASAAAANAKADEAVAALTDEQKAAMAKEQAVANADAVAAAEEQANAYADQFMTDNAEAIKNDAPGFVEASFGPEAAAQLAAQCDGFIQMAENEGVEYQGVVMTVEQITQYTMENDACINLGSEEQPYMVTPNQAVGIIADQAAAGMTDGVLNYWEGSQFGALGFGKSVCLGYAKAFNYLVQCMYPEVYGKNGANTDLTVSENWKTREELYYDENGELDLDSGYVTDLVRITFDASFTMFGQTEDNFNSDHFWNAVKLDGKWYYVDPCYTDVFTEVMMRDRVETDGSMNHMYFLFSHTSCETLYDGYFKEIKTMYKDLAVNTDYEDSWISRIKSNVYSDGEYFYYVYDSTDLITLMEDSNNSMNQSTEVEESKFKIVRHKIDTDDKQNGDTDYDVLVYFNYKANEDADPVSMVYDPSAGATKEHSYLTELYRRHAKQQESFPALALTMALYEGKIYFNVSNSILSYDLATGAIALVKEYNTVHASRDKTNAFGGMAFSIVDSAAEADLTVENRPLAGLTLKGDGKLYVSVATNFAFISGKDPHNSSDQTSYGYEFEETNYNASYSAYNDYGGMSDAELESYGYTRETNDNDEFMWSANFTETLDMAHLVGTSHNYASVTVAPDCGLDGFTEDRCTDCGAAKADSRVVAEGTALEHHYIKFEEQFYTKSESGAWNTGICYVCPMCLDAVVEPVEPKKTENNFGGQDDYEERMAEYEKLKAEFDEVVAGSGHDYVPTDAIWSSDGATVMFSKLHCGSGCTERKTHLDCLLTDPKVTVTLSGTVAKSASVVDYEGDCSTGLVATYQATGEVEGYTFVASTDIDIEAGKHAYDATFTWTDVLDENEAPTGEFTVVADLVCAICGDAHEDMEATVAVDTENSAAATCTAMGKKILVATVTVTNEDGKEIGSATSSKVIALDMIPHDYVDGVCSACGGVQLVAPTIKYCYSKQQTSVRVAWNTVQGAEGYQLWRSTDPENADSWACAKTITSGTTETYTNQGLTEGLTYYYKIRAFVTAADGSRVYSDFSNVDHMPAAVVFDGPYSNSTFRIRLRWNEVNGSHGYQIWRQNADGTFSVAKTIGDRGSELTNDQGGTTAYSNVGLTAGEDYTYKMRAFYITEDGRKIFGAFSDEMTIAVMPETPEITVTSPKAGRVSLTWDALNGTEGFQVWMSNSPDSGFAIGKSVTDGTATGATVYGLESGKTYYFKVRAYVEVNGKKTFGAYSDVIAVTVK